MMVGDHYRDASGLRLGHRLHSGDAAVARDDERCADLAGVGQAGWSEVIPVPQAMRHEGNRVRPSHPQRPGQERGGALAVYVVVTMHQYGRAGGDRSADRGHRLRHPCQLQWIRQLIE